MQRNFRDILEDYLDETAWEQSSNDSSSDNDFIFSKYATDLNQRITDAAKNIKRHFSSTQYKVFQDRQEQKRQESIKSSYEKMLLSTDLPSVKSAITFFYERGVTQFLSKKQECLKKDFRVLARKTHPDLYQNTPFQREKELEFKQLKQSYEVLQSYFHSQNMQK